jgi:hypothetical protein
MNYVKFLPLSVLAVGGGFCSNEVERDRPDPFKPSSQTAILPNIVITNGDAGYSGEIEPARTIIIQGSQVIDSHGEKITKSGSGRVEITFEPPKDSDTNPK